ncbi:Anaphase-promoting complex subunit [Arachis hypogaea]|nr:Anaphase-promoting complex subunit [Arachis hypogaea]
MAASDPTVSDLAPSLASDLAPQAISTLVVLLGDSFFREKEYHRAIHSYKQALQYNKMVLK